MRAPPPVLACLFAQVASLGGLLVRVHAGVHFSSCGLHQDCVEEVVLDQWPLFLPLAKCLLPASGYAMKKARF